MSRYAIPFFLFIAGCGSLPKDETIGFTPNGMDKNPPKPIQCDYPMMACGGKICVDLSRDKNNCGWCGVRCDSMEMCHDFRCMDPTYFGFSEGDLTRGPVDYNPVKDLPRPVPNHFEEQ